MIWLVAVAALIYSRAGESFVWINVFMGLLLDLLVIGVMKACFQRKRPSYDNAGEARSSRFMDASQKAYSSCPTAHLFYRL